MISENLLCAANGACGPSPVMLLCALAMMLLVAFSREVKRNEGTAGGIPVTSCWGRLTGVGYTTAAETEGTTVCSGKERWGSG